jgi:hypothetical protein
MDDFIEFLRIRAEHRVNEGRIRRDYTERTGSRLVGDVAGMAYRIIADCGICPQAALAEVTHHFDYQIPDSRRI